MKYKKEKKPKNGNKKIKRTKIEKKNMRKRKKLIEQELKN